MAIDNKSLIFHPAFHQAVEKLVSKSDTKRASNLIATAIQAFFYAPQELGGRVEKAAIQAFTSKADIPDPQYAFDTFVQVTNWDDRYQNAFKIRQFNPNQGSFSIVDITNAFTFDKLVEGGNVSIKKVKGTSVDVQAVTYADGVGWTWEMLEDRKFSEMVELLQLMVQEFYASKSKNYYRLITDAGYANAGVVAWQGSGTDILQRDRLTLGAMLDKVADDCKDLGVVSDVVTAQYDAYCKPSMAVRVNNALNSSLGAANGIGGVPPYNVRINPTMNLNRTSDATVLATDVVLCLSGGKTQRGDKLLPQTYSKEDIVSFSEILTARARYAGVVAEPKQIIKGAFA